MVSLLTDIQKQYIEEYIQKQPIKIVENLDFTKRAIAYSSKIKGRDIKSISGDEEIVRAYILTKLVNEYGYKPEKIEIEHEYTAGRPHTITSRIDIIVRDDKNDAFLFIELKSPKDYAALDKDLTIEEQLFKVGGMEKIEGHNVKYLVLYTLDMLGKNISDECMVIDNEKFPTFSDWEISRDFVDAIPIRYGKAQKTPYIKGTEKDLEKNFTHEILDKLQKDLHNVLWGGGSTDDNEIFSSLTNLILAKIQDEDEKNDGDIYEFQSLTFDKASSDEFETNEILFDRINDLYKRALTEKLNITDTEELKKSYVIDTKKFSLSKLKYTVQELEKYSFVDGKNSLSGKDILGDFFEGIIRTGFKQSKGQFFTHVNIVKFMLWAIQADKLAIEKINKDKEIPFMIDPSAGSGTFLIEYMKFVTQNIKYRFRGKLDTSRGVKDKVESDWFYPDYRENKWAREYIYGSELNFNLGTATKVNMILHGDGSTNIFVGAQKGDGLLPFTEYLKPSAPNALNKESDDEAYGQKVNGQFDIILTNPPFSVDLDKDTKKKVGKCFIFGDKKNSENLFIERYYQLLKENGRLAVILPESIFDTTENKYIRLFLYKYFNIKAIVSLPQLTFDPFTKTKTSILFAEKKTVVEIKKWNEIWDKYSREYENLKTRVENLIRVYSGEKQKAKLPSIKGLSETEEKEVLVRFLKAHITDDDIALSNNELIKKYQDELVELCKYNKDTEKEFGYVNTWWVFEEVSKDLNYSIFMAEADNVGYKRSKRGEKIASNDLYRTDGNGMVLVDDGIKETILDYIREIHWSRR
ncbi:restriction endonuclease subunit M [Clostridium beijerinckii]|uniref:restriction endonuclease subunit M n=1 Tax=Clostridium beijerinckii TaxID=1520 RepID=UPI00047DFA3C|nr:N-6 DNA methylase [Clostridium beijerinckii]